AELERPPMRSDVHLALRDFDLNLVYNGNSSVLPQYPFSEDKPMVTISANVCPIAWAVDLNSTAEPPFSPAQCTGGQVLMELVPYGSAKLRMSELPTF
ncbi:hypothetical protein C8R44DRAFT_807287, partial [Mycena epipterygia]